MNTFNDYLGEYVHLLITHDQDIDQWTDLFDQALENWDIPLAQRLLREAKQHELLVTAQIIVRQAEGKLASQKGELTYAIQCLHSSLLLLEKQNNLDLLLINYSQLGMLLRAHGEPQLAYEYHKRQLQLAINNDLVDWCMDAYRELGFDAYELGDLSRAEEMLEYGLELAVTHEDKARLYNVTGLVAWQRGNLQKALNNFNEALSNFEAKGDFYQANQARANLGNIYYESGDIEEAFDHYTMAMETFNHMGVIFDKIGILNNLGGIAVKHADYQKADRYFEESLNLAIEIGDRIGQQNALINLGVTAMQQGEYSKSLTNYQQALMLAREIGNHDTLRQIYKKMSRVEFIWSLESLRMYFKSQKEISMKMVLSHCIKSISYFMKS